MSLPPVASFGAQAGTPGGSGASAGWLVSSSTCPLRSSKTTWPRMMAVPRASRSNAGRSPPASSSVAASVRRRTSAWANSRSTSRSRVRAVSRKGGIGLGTVGLVVAPDEKGGDRQARDEEEKGQSEEARADRAAEEEHGKAAARLSLVGGDVRRGHRVRDQAFLQSVRPGGRRGGRRLRPSASLASARYRPRR